MHLLGIITFWALFAATNSMEYDSNKESPYVIETDSLPENMQFMPTLGNGYLGFTVFSDSIFVNGVFNGRGGLSHRARFPNVANITITPINSGPYTQQSFKLDLRQGTFEHKQSNSEIETVIRTYPHRFFNRAIINEIFVNRISSTSATRALKLAIHVHSGNMSDDLEPSTVTWDNSINQGTICSEIKEVEDPEVQTFKPNICFTGNRVPSSIQIPVNESNHYLLVVVVLAESNAVAKRELKQVIATSRESLFQLHVRQWQSLWDDFHIDLDTNLELSRTINAGVFYLASSLPTRLVNQPFSSFYGLSPTSLGRGKLSSDYEGHNFWDTEIWMLAPVTQLSPSWTTFLLNYRYQMLPGALNNANRSGYKGARFPWESAFTGVEVINPCCPEVAEYEVHITADIAFAARHYFIVTNDTQWLKREGCVLAQRIAEFWISRVSFDPNTSQYDIKGVMGPDEDHLNVTNNAFTNVVVHHALEFINLVKPICEFDSKFADEALRIAESLKVPYDPKLDYHPEYEGYNPSIIIKQADAVLLSYPLLFPMNRSTLSNNLRIYENATRETGPAMTWSMHAIGHLDEGDKKMADEFFEKSYKPYTREPFKVWSETIEGLDGAVNFLTGVGGFLQAVMNGYGGVRYHSGRMEVKQPVPLPGTSTTVIHGIKYQGSIFSLKLSNSPTITATKISSGQTLNLINGDKTTHQIIEGKPYPLKGTSLVKATAL